MRRQILSERVPLDPLLSDVAGRYPSHAFLGNATQGVFIRQVRFLEEACGRILLKPTTETRVLDWGCGKGHISHLLKERGFLVTSCDRRSARRDSSFGQETPIISRRRIEVIPLDDDVLLPFDSGTFDVVVSFGVLEHVPRDEESMAEIRRVVRPGGVFWVSFLPCFLSWTQFLSRLLGNRYHDRLYSIPGLRRLAARAGWSLVDAWHGQLFPKNSVNLESGARVEPIDRFLTEWTPLGQLATNLEALLVRP